MENVNVSVLARHAREHLITCYAPCLLWNLRAENAVVTEKGRQQRATNFRHFRLHRCHY